MEMSVMSFKPSDLQARKDHVKRTLRLLKPEHGVTLKHWTEDIESALEKVKKELLNDQPKLSFVLDKDLKRFEVPLNVIGIYVRQAGPRMIESFEIGYERDGIRMCAGIPFGYILPWEQDEEDIYSDFCVFFRKYGVAAYDKRGGVTMANPPAPKMKMLKVGRKVTDLYDDLDVVLEEPKGKYSAKLYREICKQGGVEIEVDQYFCDRSGSPVSGFLAALRSKGKSAVSAISVVALWGKSLPGPNSVIEAYGFSFKLVWLTTRKNVAYQKQNVTHIKSIKQHGESSQAHVLTLDSEITSAPAGNADYLKDLTLTPVQRRYKATHGVTLEEAQDNGYVQNIKLSSYVECSCGYTGWLAGNLLEGFVCECGIAHTRAKARSAGVIQDGAVCTMACPLSQGGNCTHNDSELLMKISPDFDVVGGMNGKQLYSFGGAVLAYIGCENGNAHFMPRLVCRVGSSRFAGIIGDAAVVKHFARLYQATVSGAHRVATKLNLVGDFIVNETIAALVANGCSSLDELMAKLKNLTRVGFIKLMQEQGYQITENDESGFDLVPKAFAAPFLPEDNYMSAAIQRMSSLYKAAYNKVSDATSAVAAAYMERYDDTEGLLCLQELIEHRLIEPTCMSTMALAMDTVVRHAKVSFSIFGDAAHAIVEKISQFLLSLPAATKAACESLFQALRTLASATWKVLNDTWTLTCTVENAIVKTVVKIINEVVKLFKSSVSYAGTTVTTYLLKSKPYLLFGKCAYEEVSEPVDDLVYPGKKPEKFSMLQKVQEEDEEEIILFDRTSDILEEVQGQLQPACAPELTQPFEGKLVSISGKLIATDGEFYYPYVKTGHCITKPYVLIGGAPTKKNVVVATERNEVREIPRERTVTIQYAIHPQLDQVFTSQCPHFVVDPDCDLEDLEAMVFDTLLTLVTKLHKAVLEQTGQGIPGFDFEEFSEGRVFLFNEDGECVIDSTVICSLYPPEDDEAGVLDEYEEEEAEAEECQEEEEESDIPDEAEASEDEECALDEEEDISKVDWGEAVEAQERALQLKEATVCEQPKPKMQDAFAFKANLLPKVQAKSSTEKTFTAGKLTVREALPILYMAKPQEVKKPVVVCHAIEQQIILTEVAEIAAPVTHSAIIHEAVTFQRATSRTVSIVQAPSAVSTPTPMAVEVCGGVYKYNKYVTIHLGDIVKLAKKLKPKVLVNAANSRLAHGGGIAGALNRATNGAMQVESDEIIAKRGEIDPGFAVMGKGYDLAGSILHVVGPDLRQKQCESILDRCYKTICKYDGVLTPLISAGIFGSTPATSLKYLLANVNKPIEVVINDEKAFKELQNVSKRALIVMGVKKAFNLAKTQQAVACVARNGPYMTRLMEFIGKDGVKVPDLKVHEQNGLKYMLYSDQNEVADVYKAMDGLHVVATPVGHLSHAMDLNAVASAYAAHILPSTSGTIVCTSEDMLKAIKSAGANDLLPADDDKSQFIQSCIENAGYKYWVLDRTAFSCTFKDELLTFDGLLVNKATNERVGYNKGCFCLYEPNTNKVTLYRSAKAVRGMLDTKKSPKVQVLVTSDGVNYATRRVDCLVPFGNSLGFTLMDGVDVTAQLPTMDDQGKQLWCFKDTEDAASLKETYGVEDSTFASRYMCLLQKVYQWTVCKAEGFISFKQKDNNCFVNTAILVLQRMRGLKFKPSGLQYAFMELKGGQPQKFAALAMAYAQCDYGQPGDALNLVLELQKHMEIDAEVRITKWCEDCGVKTDVFKGAETLVYMGGLLLDDFFKIKEEMCACGKKQMQCVTYTKLPWLIMADAPSANKMELPEEASCASVYQANHFWFIARKDLFLYRVDGGVTTKFSEYTAHMSFILYPGVNRTQELDIKTFILDGKCVTQLNPDLTKYYVKDGVYSTQKPESDITPLPVVSSQQYENVHFYSDVLTLEDLNKQIGYDGLKSTMAYKVTPYPDASGDAVLCDFTLYSPELARGASFRGKPVVWHVGNKFTSAVKKHNMTASRHFRGQPVEVTNKYSVLEVEPVQMPCEEAQDLAPMTIQTAVVTDSIVDDILVPTEDGVGNAIFQKVQVVELKGDFKPFKTGDVVVQPTSREDAYELHNELTAEIVQSMWIRNVFNVVVRKANDLSRLLNVSTLAKNGLSAIASVRKRRVAIVKYAQQMAHMCGTAAETVRMLPSAYRYVRNSAFGQWAAAWFATLISFFLPSYGKFRAHVNVAEFAKAGVISKNMIIGVLKATLTPSLSAVCNHGFKVLSVLLLLACCYFARNIWFYSDVLSSQHYASTFVQFFKNASDYRTQCDVLMEDYYNTSFDADLYCRDYNGSKTFCAACLKGVDSLSRYTSLSMQQVIYSTGFTIDWDMAWSLLEWYMAYLLYTPAFNGLVIVGLLKLFIYTGLFDINVLLLTIQYALLFMPMSSLLRAYTLLAAIYKLYGIYTHVVFGCRNVSCLYCYKRNRASRVECTTILNGSKRSFYVNASGGTSYCQVHNWNCINCDVYDTSSTFITAEVAQDLSNMFKRTVNPTDKAYYEVTKVETKNGCAYFYYERDGAVMYDRVPLNIASKTNEHSYAEIAKSNTMKYHIIYYDSSNRVETTQVRNACVYYAQLLCRPILCCDIHMVQFDSETKIVQKMFDAYCDVYNNTFNVESKKTQKQREEVRALIDGGETLDNVIKTFVNSVRGDTGVDSDAETDDVVQSIKFAHTHNAEFSNESFNNYVPSIIGDQNFTPYDLGVMADVGAKKVNINVLKNMGHCACIWNASAFFKLSERARRTIRAMCNKQSVSFKLTTATTRAVDSALVTRYTNVGGAPRISVAWFNIVMILGALTLFLGAVAGLSYYMIPSHTNVLAPTKVGGADTAYDFLVIDNGIMRALTDADDCVANKFADFLNTEHAQTIVTRYSDECPVVVAVNFDDIGSFVPGIPGKVFWYGRQILHFVTQSFASGAETGCFTPHQHLASNDFVTGACVLSSECTRFLLNGVVKVFCHDTSIFDGSLPYSQLKPHTKYPLYGSGVGVEYIRFPEVLVSNVIRIVRTMNMEYCRYGSCEQSEQGVCLSMDGTWVLNNQFYLSRPGVYCGDTFVKLFASMVSPLVQPVNFINFTVSVGLVSVLSLFSAFAMYYALKLRRWFGDYTAAFVVNFFAWVSNVVVLCMMQAWPWIAMPYSLAYFYATFYFSNEVSALMHTLWFMSFALVNPVWMVAMYVAGLILKHSYFLLQLFATKKVELFTNGQLNSSFAEAAKQTFLIDKAVYTSLKTAISAETFNRYLAMYNKYKYYAGTMDTASYTEAACCFLAKALAMYNENGGRDILYQPPTCTVSSAILQAGLVKMAMPSGKVEKCMVRVTCGNMTLNGLWLANKVYCPRHVVCTREELVDPDYDRIILRKANHDFSVTKGNAAIRVVSVRMRGSMLELGTDMSNPNTPAHTFVRVKPGATFSILACYNGEPAGVFQVSMRPNSTIKGSFLCGSCGSIGYNVEGDNVAFCYMHQMELPSGAHTGTDFDGNFYGDFQDRQTPQSCSVDKYVTVNVAAWLYGAIINGERWFIRVPPLSVPDFNKWALQNGFEQYVDTNMLDALIAKTSVSIEQILGAIRDLTINGMRGRLILGQATLEDELTAYDVQRQLMGVVMQGRFTSGVKGICTWFITMVVLGVFMCVELCTNTFLQYVPLQYSAIVYLALSAAVACVLLFVKHRHAYLTAFVLPSLSVLSYMNVVDQNRHWLVNYVVDFVMEQLGVVNVGLSLMTMFTMFGSVALLFMLCYRSIKLNFMGCCMLLMQLGWWFYNYYVQSSTLPYCYLLFLSGIFTPYGGTTFCCMTLARFLTACFIAMYPNVTLFLPQIKLSILAFMVIGYFCTCYFGFFCMVNKWFRFTLGVYDYKVSHQEFRYMNSNGLSAPLNSWQAFKLNLKLAGVGGVPCIKISALQSKFTDVKCTSVVLLNCLQQLRVESNSALWKACVKLHNEILESKDTAVCFEKFVTLLTTLLGMPGAINLDELCDDILSDSCVMQSVTNEFHNMASFIEMENAQKTLDEAVRAGESPQVIKQLTKAVNIAKAAYEKDKSVARKLERMADQAMTQMYKQARAEDKKAKVISAMQSMLFAMIKRLDNNAVNNVIQLARNGCVPLNIFPAMVSNHLCVVVPDGNIWESVITWPTLNYAGALWDITQVKDSDNQIIESKDIRPDTYSDLCWPLIVQATRQNGAIKLQNNELMPTTIRQISVAAGPEQNACSENSTAFYTQQSGGRLILAVVSSESNLRWTRVNKANGDGFVMVELEQPCKFIFKGANGPEVRYLYFVQRLNTLHRGQVLGHLAATVRLQAGTATEYASNSTALSLCAFAADPRKAYMDYINNGGLPIANCVKMLSPHTGTGVAISVKPEANMEQESFGGASCCLYCRAHIDHPSALGTCMFKGKFVQIPQSGLKDPVLFCLKNTVCNVCSMWKGYGCNCDSLRENGIALQASSENFLNESGVLV